jgi:D-serine deaminase-like pyridoxal phosphate-dependent protein
MRSAPAFSFFLDSKDVARAVADFARAQRLALRVWIEVDSGEHRTGVEAEGDLLLEIAAILADSPALLAGVATHGGHSYTARDAARIAAIADEERLTVLRAAERLRAAGHEVPGVSAGSTPTAVYGRTAEGLTEIRAGVYMAGDLFQAAIGSQGEAAIAASVVATVISHKPEHNQIVVDAGGLALSKDRSTGAIEGGDLGYGLVVDLAGKPSLVASSSAECIRNMGNPRDFPLPFDRCRSGPRFASFRTMSA